MSRPSGFRARVLQGQARRSPRLPKAVGFTSSPEETASLSRTDNAFGAATCGPWTVPGLRTAPTTRRPQSLGKPANGCRFSTPPTDRAQRVCYGNDTATAARSPGRDQPIMRNALPVVFPRWRSSCRATGGGTRTPDLGHWAWNVTTACTRLPFLGASTHCWSSQCPRMSSGSAQTAPSSPPWCCTSPS